LVYVIIFVKEGLMKRLSCIMVLPLLMGLMGLNSCVSIASLAKPWEEGEAQIIIERQDDTRRKMDVELNGQFIGRIRDVGKYYFIVKGEGTYTLRISINPSNFTVYSEAKRFSIDNSGQKHFFITKVSSVIKKDTIIPLEYRIEGSSGPATGIEGAIDRAIRDLITDLPRNSRIAVINISSNNRDLSFLAVEEIEYQLFSAKMTIVDRQTLDRIRSEQNFQMSGDVSDESAVSIGQMLGANIVITGSITGTGSAQRISIRALDVRTAQIVAIVRETF
jgi:TolB-like protein